MTLLLAFTFAHIVPQVSRLDSPPRIGGLGGSLFIAAVLRDNFFHGCKDKGRTAPWIFASRDHC